MKLVCPVTDSMHYEDSRGMGRPRIHIGGGEKQGGRNGRPGAGGSARDEFPPRNRYARPCERMRGGAGRFSREKDKVTAGAGDKGRHDGYVRTVERLGRPSEAGL